MNDAQSSGANGGLRAGSLSPEELEKFAALFVPTWEQPLEAGVAPPPDDVFRAAAEPVAVGAARAADPKKTMMGMAAPIGAPQPEAPFVPPQRAAVDPMRPTGAVDFGAVAAQPVIRSKPSMPAPSLADASGEMTGIPRKRSPLIFLVGGGVVVAALAIFFVTRGGDKPPPKKETAAPMTEGKKLDLPDPNSVSTTTTAATKDTTTAKTADTATAAPAATIDDTSTATAKAPETATAASPPPPPAKTAEPPPPPPKATVTAAPKPPPIVPPPKATAAPKPPPAATAKPPGPKKPQKIKDEF